MMMMMMMMMMMCLSKSYEVGPGDLMGDLVFRSCFGADVCLFDDDRGVNHIRRRP
jgi:hypothetical protein